MAIVRAPGGTMLATSWCMAWMVTEPPSNHSVASTWIACGPAFHSPVGSARPPSACATSWWPKHTPTSRARWSSTRCTNSRSATIHGSSRYES